MLNIEKIIELRIINEKCLTLIFSWKKWLREDQKLSNSTFTCYINDLSQFLEFLYNKDRKSVGLAKIEEVKLIDFNEWAKSRSNIHKPQSTRRALCSIKSFFYFLKKSKIIKNNEAQLINLPIVKEKLPVILSKEQIKKLIRALGNQPKYLTGLRYQALAFLSYICGLRISESLQITQKDLAKGQLKINGRYGRTVIIPKGIKTLCEKYVAQCPFKIEEHQSIFIRKNGKVIRPEVVCDPWRKISKKVLGLKDGISPFAFRHSYAVQMLENDLSIQIIQQSLGLKGENIMEKYLQCCKKSTRINHSTLDINIDTLKGNEK